MRVGVSVCGYRPTIFTCQFRQGLELLRAGQDHCGGRVAGEMQKSRREAGAAAGGLDRV